MVIFKVVVEVVLDDDEDEEDVACGELKNIIIVSLWFRDVILFDMGSCISLLARFGKRTNVFPGDSLVVDRIRRKLYESRNPLPSVDE